jgi:hypothetical protein
MEYIVFSVVLVFVWFVGAMYGWNLHQKVVNRRISTAIDKFAGSIEDNIIKVKLERHNDMLYMYQLDTHQFMAMGKTEEELTNVLKEKFPGKTFAASTKDIEESGLKNESI